MNDEQSKLQASCSTVGMVVRVAFYLLLLILAIKIGSNLWLSTIASSQYHAIKNYDQSITITAMSKDYASVRIPAALTVPERTISHKKTVFLISAWTDCITLVLISAIMWHLRNIFKRIDKDGSPFQKKNVNDLCRSAFIMMSLSIVPAFFQAFLLITLGIAQSAALNEILNPKLSWLLTGGIILCIAQIFRYGCYLQTESDETL